MEQVPPNSEKMAKFTGSANTLEIAGGNYHFLGGCYNFWGSNYHLFLIEGKIINLQADLIFVTGITDYIRGEIWTFYKKKKFEQFVEFHQSL